MRILLLLLLTGCNIAQQHPGAIQCEGKATLAGNGAVAIYSGAGMLSFDCGSGAFLRQGADVMEGTPAPTPLPPAPPIGSYFMGTDGRIYWSAAPPQSQAVVAPPAQPVAPPPIVRPHRPPVPPPAVERPSSSTYRPPPLMIRSGCVPGWTATSWLDEPGVPRCR